MASPFKKRQTIPRPLHRSRPCWIYLQANPAKSLGKSKHRMFRYIAFFFAFLCFLRVAVDAAPIVAHTRDAQNIDQKHTTNSSTATQGQWIDMSDNLQPLPSPQVSEIPSAMSRASLQDEVSGFYGPFAQFIAHQYGTNLDVTDFYMEGFCCGLASIAAAAAAVASLYVVVGSLFARLWR